MTREELLQFASHVWSHCESCSQIRPGWGPEVCQRHDCLLHHIRLLKQTFELRPKVLDKLVASGEPDEKAQKLNRIIK